MAKNAPVREKFKSLLISAICQNICRSERLAYTEGQPINIGMIIVKSTAPDTKSIIENSTQEIVYDCKCIINKVAPSFVLFTD